jgi:hypothetical protein
MPPGRRGRVTRDKLDTLSSITISDKSCLLSRRAGILSQMQRLMACCSLGRGKQRGVESSAHIPLGSPCAQPSDNGYHPYSCCQRSEKAYAQAIWIQCRRGARSASSETTGAPPQRRARCRRRRLATDVRTRDADWHTRRPGYSPSLVWGSSITRGARRPLASASATSAAGRTTRKSTTHSLSSSSCSSPEPRTQPCRAAAPRAAGHGRIRAFRPRLIGPALRGTATPEHGIELRLFADSPEEVLMELMERRIPWQQREETQRYARCGAGAPGVRVRRRGHSGPAAGPALAVAAPAAARSGIRKIRARHRRRGVVGVAHRHGPVGP